MRALTPLMLPTSLQPPLTGPRDGMHTGANRITIHRIADDDDADAAPAPPPAPSTQEPPMSTQQRVIDALTKKQPRTNAELIASTGMNGVQLRNAVFNLRKAGKIITTGHAANAVHRLADGTASAAAPVAKARKGKRAATPFKFKQESAKPASFAEGVAQIEREQAGKRRANGTDMPPANKVVPSLFVPASGFMTPEQFRHKFGNLEGGELMALSPRAIRKADGGAIILRGHTLTAELNAEELDVIHQLRG